MKSFAIVAAALTLPLVLLAADPAQPSALTAHPAQPSTSVLVVEVTPEHGPRLVIPVPYIVVRAGVALAPRHIRQIPVPGLAPHMDDLHRALATLQDTPDGVFVEIEGPDEHVMVEKRDGALRVVVLDGDHTRVQAVLPFSLLASARNAFDGETTSLHTGALVRALRDAPRGPLVHLLDGGTEVEIRAW